MSEWPSFESLFHDGDEGIDPLSDEIIQQAIELAKQLKDKGFEKPDNIVTDVNGGLVFEWRDGDKKTVFHIWDDGVVEYMRFHGSCLIERAAVKNGEPCIRRYDDVGADSKARRKDPSAAQRGEADGCSR